MLAAGAQQNLSSDLWFVREALHLPRSVLLHSCGVMDGALPQAEDLTDDDARALDGLLIDHIDVTVRASARHEHLVSAALLFTCTLPPFLMMAFQDRYALWLSSAVLYTITHVLTAVRLQVPCRLLGSMELVDMPGLDDTRPLVNIAISQVHLLCWSWMCITADCCGLLIQACRTHLRLVSLTSLLLVSLTSTDLPTEAYYDVPIGNPV